MTSSQKGPLKNFHLRTVRSAGFGSTLHIRTVMLWVQQRWSKNEVDYNKVSGSDNMADLLAKHVLLSVRCTLDAVM